jgi:alpha-tubulin suppressor-like RCC1 family protein
MRLSAMTGFLAGVSAAGLLAAVGAAPAGAVVTPPPEWVHVAAGEYFTCGIREGNTLWCWGRGTDGELGNGQAGNELLPQQITRKTAGWTGVSAGDFHACATRNDGGLWCWGSNLYGQTGVGTTAGAHRPLQVTSPAADGWVSVTAGIDHTCALRADSTLWCWGRNDTGALGIGSTTSQSLPQQVTTPAADGWTSVNAVANNTCATRGDGTLWCWGFNSSGQLGIGTTTSQDLPQQVTAPAAGGWASVVSGATTCATRGDTTLWCWGSGTFGQLGTGSTINESLPQQVSTPAAAGWTSVRVGYGHVCATRTHALWCWGLNDFGQLGTGDTADSQLNTPQRVTSPTAAGWTLIAAGGDHTCATHTGHALYCWGYNGFGQLGLGTTGQQNTPQHVTS